MIVRLNEDEQKGLYQYAENAYKQAHKDSYRVRVHEEIDTIKTQYYGFAAEYACSLLYKIKWLRNIKLSDLEFGIEVRTAMHSKKGNNLLYRDPDNIKSPYILCDASEFPDIDIVGWQWGYECKRIGTKRKCYTGTHHYYIVKRHQLLPPAGLFDYIRFRQGLNQLVLDKNNLPIFKVS